MKKPLTIAVTSPQGGSGKSTLAVQLALYWAKQSVKTILVDWAGYGSLPPMLKLPPKGKGLSAFLNDLEQHDAFSADDPWNGSELLKEAYVQHEQHRALHVLFAANVLKMDKMSHRSADRLIQLIQSDTAQIVIIDLSSELNERHVAALEAADVIVTCALPDVISGWKLVQFKEVSEQLGIAPDKFRLVVNRISRHSDFSPDELSKETGWNLLGELPELGELLPAYVNRGIPLEESGKVKLLRPFRAIADQLFKKVVDVK